MSGQSVFGKYEDAPRRAQDNKRTSSFRGAKLPEYAKGTLEQVPEVESMLVTWL